MIGMYAVEEDLVIRAYLQGELGIKLVREVDEIHGYSRQLRVFKANDGLPEQRFGTVGANNDIANGIMAVLEFDLDSSVVVRRRVLDYVGAYNLLAVLHFDALAEQVSHFLSAHAHWLLCSHQHDEVACLAIVDR